MVHSTRQICQRKREIQEGDLRDFCCSVYVWVRVIFENDWVVGDNDWPDFVIKGK